MWFQVAVVPCRTSSSNRANSFHLSFDLSVGFLLLDKGKSWVCQGQQKCCLLLKKHLVISGLRHIQSLRSLLRIASEGNNNRGCSFCGAEIGAIWQLD